MQSNNLLREENWKVKKICVIGPGIVGMPMAALLANSRIKIGYDEPAEVVVIQRNSRFSGWKVEAINSGKSVIGGIEPELDEIVADSVKNKLLRASHSTSELADADVILICVQTDKKGFGPDYEPLFEALESVGEALQKKPADKIPLLIFESTLAPSTMSTLIKSHFAKFNLIEGKNILLGNSPNRVMPGRLVERVVTSDKLVAGLSSITPILIKKLYSHIVKKGSLYPTNSMTAEVVKTLENAYRDVRIAFASEIVRYCDDNNINFYKVRDEVNKSLHQMDEATGNPNVVPSGGLLVPTIGVGGHCLPKDGILLWWRKIEHKLDTSKSLILKSRQINDASPKESINHSEKYFGSLNNKNIALLGTAYRFNSEDTRNSPTLFLAKLLLEKGCTIKIHDPYVKPDDQNLLKFKLESYFTRDLMQAINNADYIFVCTAHKYYMDELDTIKSYNPSLKGLFDGCNIYSSEDFIDKKIIYTGIGRGINNPDLEFIDFVLKGFHAMEKGLANELNSIIKFLNDNFADDEFNKIDFKDVQKLAGSCGTGCIITDPDKVKLLSTYKDFLPLLAAYSVNI
jgi:UDP-N-acetyl-D-mannosaminuronic acid dehydrogenase